MIQLLLLYKNYDKSMFAAKALRLRGLPRCVAVLLEDVPLFSFGDLSVLNGLCGTVCYTRHTVSALVSPYRLFVFKLYVVKRAKLYTLAAAYTAILGAKILGGKLAFTPYGIKRKRDKRFEEKNVPCLKLIARHNIRRNLVKPCA